MSRHSIDRAEYLLRVREFVKRGLDLPQTKLTPLEVSTIKSALRQREKLRQYINENLSNAALAEKFGVSPRTIEKIASGRTWIDVQ